MTWYRELKDTIKWQVKFDFGERLAASNQEQAVYRAEEVFKQRLLRFFKEQQRRFDDHIEKSGLTQDSITRFDWHSEDKLLIEIYKDSLGSPVRLGQDFAFENMADVIKKVNARKGKSRGKKEGIYNIWTDFETRVPQAETLVENRILDLSERWGEVPNFTTQAEMMNQLAIGYQHFESIGDLKDRITDIWDDCQTWRAEMIARTETMRAFNNAGLDYYKATGVVDKVELIIASDACPRCQEERATQTEYTLDEAQGLLPFHPNCRCTYGPIVAEERATIPEAVSPETGLPSDFIGEITNMARLGGTASDTYTGFVDGEKYLFKRNVPANIGIPMKTSNLEAELLSTDVFNAAGLEAPPTKFGTFKIGNQQERLLSMKWLDDVQTASDFIDLNGAMDYLQAVDQYGFKKMQVIDVMIGNGDRHMGNFFFNNLGEVIPIDNGLAFATDNVITGDWQKCFLQSTSANRDYQTAAHILTRNQVGAEIIEEEASVAIGISPDKVLSMYKDTIAEIQETFTDDIIASMVEKLPDTLVDIERRQEIVETWAWRRDHLEEIITQGFR